MRRPASPYAFEKIGDELGLEIANTGRADLEIDDGVRPAAQIDGRHGERFVHRHHEVARAIDAAAVAKRVRDSLAERDAEILDGVMLVDVEVARRIDLEIERAVPRHELEHVIEKADAGAHAVAALAVERDGKRDRRFSRLPID